MVTVRLKAVGGWIDATYSDEALTMAAVGPPLLFLAKEPANTAQRQKRTEARGRYRRMALDALHGEGVGEAVDEAEIVWTHRAG